MFVWRSSTKHHYSMKLSTRLGRTRYKEQFLFLYRCQKTNKHTTLVLCAWIRIRIADISLPWFKWSYAKQKNTSVCRIKCNGKFSWPEDFSVFSGMTWLTWWGPISLMISWPKEEMFLPEILTSWGSDASTQVTVIIILMLLHVECFCTDVEELWICIWLLFFCSICVSTSVLKDLVMIPVHTKPEDSEKELDELYDVFLNVTQKWATDVRWRVRQ